MKKNKKKKTLYVSLCLALVITVVIQEVKFNGILYSTGMGSRPNK